MQADLGRRPLVVNALFRWLKPTAMKFYLPVNDIRQI